jgi:hypothetical protein
MLHSATRDEPNWATGDIGDPGDYPNAIDSQVECWRFDYSLFDRNAASPTHQQHSNQ